MDRITLDQYLNAYRSDSGKMICDETDLPITLIACKDGVHICWKDNGSRYLDHKP